MTPQEFVDTLIPPESYRRVAIVAAVPLYTVAQWLSAVRTLAGNRFDAYGFRINPQRLQCFIDGVSEPRLTITFHDAIHGEDDALRGVQRSGLTIIKEISL